jgi:crotonyl-CoA carboxylase/reductase
MVSSDHVASSYRMPAVVELKPAPLHKDLYAIGEIPPLGHVPAKMHAWVIRKERHGPPLTSMQLEVVPTWSIGEDEVLVHVMAGGVNYNGVWAGLGIPISPLDGHKNSYHVAGPTPPASSGRSAPRCGAGKSATR